MRKRIGPLQGPLYWKTEGESLLFETVLEDLTKRQKQRAWYAVVSLWPIWFQLHPSWASVWIISKQITDIIYKYLNMSL